MIVFLDIDGVLNCRKDWAVPFTLNQGCLDNFTRCFGEIDTKIILTSSWRKGFVSAGNSKNTPQIQALEQELRKRGFVVRGITSPGISDRTKAVKEVLSKIHDNYIILDDDLSEFEDKNMSGLYLVNNKTGFTKEDAKKIKKIIRL